MSLNKEVEEQAKKEGLVEKVQKQEDEILEIKRRLEKLETVVFGKKQI